MNSFDFKTSNKHFIKEMQRNRKIKSNYWGFDLTILAVSSLHAVHRIKTCYIYSFTI